MQRYFVSESQFQPDGKITIAGDDVHHIARVMRAQPGDEMIVTDGASREVLARIADISKDEVRAEVVRELEMAGEPVTQVWIAQALPKGDKMETVIQKCTELGAAAFIPFESERTIVQYDRKKETKRLERWHKIAKEAAEQSHRSKIPRIAEPRSWKRLLDTIGEASAAWICYEKEDATALREQLRRRLASPGAPEPGPLLVIIGPEGGFTEKEVEQAEAAGAKAVTLGKRILRTETAALAALACIMYDYGEMGG